MIGREKVVREIEDALSDDMAKAGYIYGLSLVGLKDKALTDALSMLKEQEAVEPIKLENWWKCPSCSGNIVSNMKYCPGCGRKVKWE